MATIRRAAPIPTDPAVALEADGEPEADAPTRESGGAGDGAEGLHVVASPDLAPPPTFDELYRDEYDPMVRVAFLLVGNLESAEELVQDAFIRVHLRWDRIDVPGAFLRTCVVNACRDRLRRRGRLRERMPRLVTDATDRTDAADPGPAAELHDVLLALPLRQRTAIVGRFYCGWDDRTIAEVLGVRVPTVRSLVHRGLAALRTEIPR